MSFKNINVVANEDIVSDNNPFPVKFTGLDGRYPTSKAFTRPENTTGYTAGDVIGIADSGTPANAGSAIHKLTSCGPAGGVVRLAELALQIGLTAVTSGMANFRVHFYNANPTAILDNAAFDFVSGDRGKYLGYVDLVTPEDFGSTLWTQGPVPRDKELQLASGQTSFWVQIETRGTYTPASATAYTLIADFAAA